MKPSLKVHSYEHPFYKPGAVVFVSTRIRELHSEAPTAGKSVKVCEGTYHTSDQPEVADALHHQEQTRPHTSLVPVLVEGRMWFIEEEHVKKREGNDTYSS